MDQAPPRLEREAGRQAFQIIAPFDIPIARGAVDGDIDLGAAAFEGRQVFDVPMDKPRPGDGFKGRAVLGLGFGGPRRHMMAFQSALNRTA